MNITSVCRRLAFHIFLLMSILIFSCKSICPSSPPQDSQIEILFLQAFPDSMLVGDSATLTCVANQPVSYLWSCGYGDFATDPTSNTVAWLAPDSAGTFTVFVELSTVAETKTASVSIIVSSDTTPEGYLTYSFDDGMLSVYENALPILEAYDQIGCANVFVNSVLSDNPNAMHLDELLDLQERGWQINSHSISHPRFDFIPQTYDDEILEGWVADDIYDNVYSTQYTHEQLPFILLDDEKLIELGSLYEMANQTGSYYFDVDSGSVYVQTPDGDNPSQHEVRTDSVERELEQSRIELTELGLNIENFVVPHNDWDSTRAQLASQYYETAAAGYGLGQIYANTLPLDYPLWLYRKSVYTNTTVEDVIAWIDQYIISEGKYLILAFHGIGSDVGYEPWPGENLEQVAAYAASRHIRVIPQMILVE